jgi:hypothetical protein
LYCDKKQCQIMTNYDQKWPNFRPYHPSHVIISQRGKSADPPTLLSCDMVYRSPLQGGNSNQEVTEHHLTRNQFALRCTVNDQFCVLKSQTTWNHASEASEIFFEFPEFEYFWAVNSRS